MELVERQHGVVGRWQLVALGWSPDAIRHHVGGLRALGRGVYVDGSAPLTDRQRWWAAVCSAPESTLSHASAAALWGFGVGPAGFEVVTRAGSGGPRRYGALLVCHSLALDGDIAGADGLPVTSPARTLLDLMAGASERAARRMMREALRLRRVDETALRIVAARHRGRRGRRRLVALTDEYAALPMARTRSDAEALALPLLAAAGVDAPVVNRRVAGFEADLVWPSRRLIVELDGPSFHRFPGEDARRDAAWSAAGWEVRRVPTDAVYEQPERFLALVRR
jgi:very-short-patch-repair endonuclease